LGEKSQNYHSREFHEIHSSLHSKLHRSFARFRMALDLLFKSLLISNVVSRGSLRKLSDEYVVSRGESCLMSCKIEPLANRESEVVLTISGHLQVEHLKSLGALIGSERAVALDLNNVTLIDREAVNFLAARERDGIELRNCPAFLREWIAKDRLV